MDETTLANRTAWDKAHQAQLWAYDEMSAEAATGATLIASERELGCPCRSRAPRRNPAAFDFNQG